MGKRDTAMTAVMVVEPIKKPYIKSIPEKVFFYAMIINITVSKTRLYISILSIIFII